MMPGAHLKESFGESMNPGVYQRLDMIADHYHFDTKGNWSDSRDGQANDLGGGHAHIGAAIYNGSLHVATKVSRKTDDDQYAWPCVNAANVLMAWRGTRVARTRSDARANILFEGWTCGVTPDGT